MLEKIFNDQTTGLTELRIDLSELKSDFNTEIEQTQQDNFQVMFTWR